MDAHPSLKMKPERREALFHAATREFTEHGFKQASLNRIIGNVAMSKSSFYHYFGNKTELFQQIMQQTMAPIAALTDTFTPETLTAQTFWPEILAASKGMNDLLSGNPEIFAVGRMFHRNLTAPGALCQGMMEAPIAMVNRLLEHGKVIGTIRDDLPTSLLRDSVMALGMAMDRWAVENMADFDPADFEAFQEKTAKMFIGLLSPEH